MQHSKVEILLQIIVNSSTFANSTLPWQQMFDLAEKTLRKQIL